MVKCSKCGAENLDTANFCSNCGAKIEILEEQYTCSKCGAVVHGKQSFCTGCGAKLIYAENEEDAFAMPQGTKAVERPANKPEVVKHDEPKQTASKDGNKSLLSSITNIIFSSLILLVVVLSLVSIFLPFAKAKASVFSISVEESKGFKYWFGDCWKNFSDMEAGYQIGTIFNFLSFIAAIVVTITFGIIASIKAVNSLVSGKENKGLFNAAAGAVIGSLQYFIFSAANYVALVSAAGISEGIAPGAGYGLAFASLFILLSVVVARAIVMFVGKNINLKTMLFRCIFPVMVGIILLISFNKPFYVIDSAEMSAKAYTGVFPILSQLTTSNYATTRMDLTMAFVILMGLIACSSVLVANVLSKNNKFINVVFFAIIFALLILFVIFGKYGLANYVLDGYDSYYNTVSIKEILSTIKVSGGLIFGIVLSGACLGGAITQTILEK